MKAEIKNTEITTLTKGMEEICAIHGDEKKGYRVIMRRGWIEEFEKFEDAEKWVEKNRERIMVLEMLNLQTEIKTIAEEFKKLRENE